MTKLVPCSYDHCGSRRAHYTQQDTPRGTQYVEVPDDYSANRPAFCSVTCKLLYAGWKEDQ